MVADRSFRAVLPFNTAHARMFQVQADLRKALGLPGFAVYPATTWDPVDPFERLSPAAAAIQVDTMRGEYRAAALNLANNTGRPLKVRIRAEGLPDSPAPEYLTVHEVEWTDTAQGRPVAAALPEAPRNDGAWTVTVLPGLVRQVWFTFHVTDVPAGNYEGEIVAESAGFSPHAPCARAPCVALRFPQANHPMAGRMELHQWRRQLRPDAAKPPGVPEAPPKPLRQCPVGHGKRHAAVPVHGRSADGATRYQRV